MIDVPLGNGFLILQIFSNAQPDNYYGKDTKKNIGQSELLFHFWCDKTLNKREASNLLVISPEAGLLLNPWEWDYF